MMPTTLMMTVMIAFYESVYQYSKSIASNEKIFARPNTRLEIQVVLAACKGSVAMHCVESSGAEETTPLQTTIVTCRQE